MSIEIERKFRLAEAPERRGDHDAESIDQGYLTIEAGEGAESGSRSRSSGHETAREGR
ncbi:MAG: hypothetical protein ACRDL1_04370 [Solirubrobacterales bacterium]